jgi:hypothetical protein
MFFVALAQQMTRGRERVCDVVGATADAWIEFTQRETEEKARQPETKLGAIAHTPPSKATQRKAKPKQGTLTHTWGAEQA